MFKIYVFILLCAVFVKGLPFVKTSFDLGSETGFCLHVETSGSSILWDSVLLSSCEHENISEGVQQKMLFNGVGPISIKEHQRCLEVKPKSGGWDVVLRPCWTNLPAQNFTLIQEGCMIKNEKVGYCLAAGSTVSSIGDLLTRTLQVVDCKGVSGTLLSWDAHPYSFNTKLNCNKPTTGWKFPKWAAVIFVIFGLITCYCACWILFCPSFCRKQQKQMGLALWKKSPIEISSDKTLRCPAGHEIRAVPNQAKRSCKSCFGEQFVKGAKVYLCPQCDWIICHSCYRLGKTCAPSAPVATQPLTPQSKEMNVIRKSSVIYKQVPIEKSAVKVASVRLNERALKEDDLAVNKAPNLLARIRKNIFGEEQQEVERSVVDTPERIMAEIDKIRSVVRVVRGMQRRSASRRDFRSPRDYSYSPRHRRRSRRYQRYSDSYSSTSSSEDIENSPIRRPWRRREKRRRAAYY